MNLWCIAVICRWSTASPTSIRRTLFIVCAWLTPVCGVKPCSGWPARLYRTLLCPQEWKRYQFCPSECLLMVSLPQNLNQCFNSQIMKLCDSKLGQQGAPAGVRKSILSLRTSRFLLCHLSMFLLFRIKRDQGRKEKNRPVRNPDWVELTAGADSSPSAPSSRQWSRTAELIPPLFMC